MLSDAEAVARLQPLDDGAKLRLALLKDQKRQKGRKLYLERLEPVRLAYHRLGPTERAVLVAKVVAAISSPRPLVARKDLEDEDG